MKYCILTILFFSAVSLASTMRFDCRTTKPVDKPSVRMTFSLIESRGRIGLVTNDADIPVQVYPRNSRVFELNDDYGVTATTDATGQDVIILTGDGEECAYVSLTLFKGAGYHFGFVSIESNGYCGTDGYVSPVSCAVTPVN